MFKLYNRALHRVIRKKIITITNYSTNNSGVAILNFIGGTLTRPGSVATLKLVKLLLIPLLANNYKIT